MDNNKICHRLLFRERGKQNFVQPFLRDSSERAGCDKSHNPTIGRRRQATSLEKVVQHEENIKRLTDDFVAGNRTLFNSYKFFC